MPSQVLLMLAGVRLLWAILSADASLCLFVSNQWLLAETWRNVEASVKDLQAIWARVPASWLALRQLAHTWNLVLCARVRAQKERSVGHWEELLVAG